LFDICAVDDLPPGEKRLVELDDLEIGVFNCNGQMFAIEDPARTTTASSSTASSMPRSARSSAPGTARDSI